MTAMHQRAVLSCIFALVAGRDPVHPGRPPFWITLLNNIGLSALVAIGLVLLTGVGGLTSFGQAAFCGFGAYTTAVLTTTYGVSPWLTLPLVARRHRRRRRAARRRSRCGCRATTCRSAPSPGASASIYLFGNLDFLGRYDGMSGIPPLSIGPFECSTPAAIYLR